MLLLMLSALISFAYASYIGMALTNADAPRFYLENYGLFHLPVNLFVSGEVIFFCAIPVRFAITFGPERAVAMAVGIALLLAGGVCLLFRLLSRLCGVGCCSTALMLQANLFGVLPRTRPPEMWPDADQPATAPWRPLASSSAAESQSARVAPS